MIAFAPEQMRAIYAIVLSTREEVHLDDIETAAQGQFILDDVDAVLDAIETQIADADDGISPNDSDWRHRAQAPPQDSSAASATDR